MPFRDEMKVCADSGKVRVCTGLCGFIEEVVVDGTKLVGLPAEGERRVIFDVLVPDGGPDRPGDAHLG